MPSQQQPPRRFLNSKSFLGLLASVYLVYLVTLVHFLSPVGPATSPAVVEHTEQAAPTAELQHWSPASMRSATDADLLNDTAANLTQSNVQTPVKKAQQPGVPPSNGDSSPLTTVGKIFFTNNGQSYVCSGTAIRSNNKNTVDTAGHCLYWNGVWVENLIFCPQYDNGKTPFGCWAARDLEVPSDWINGSGNDFHHDMGMAVVAPNSQGNLTDLVGGSGWAYNQAINQPFYAYGYPAAGRFDGQTRQACDNGDEGKSWQHGGGTVISIPCDMTGGSSGGPWFIKINGTWYLDGHNDFISSAQPGHMFSPYYDDTWYSLYQTAQND